MKLKHFVAIHFKEQLFNAVGGGSGSILPPGTLYVEEIKTLGLGIELGILTVHLVIRIAP